ncbi:MAG: hypothetical protein IJJ33_07580 [Victivallales bacterium]|nr:hypothetical protein [Victivallales bacterium]
MDKRAEVIASSDGTGFSWKDTFRPGSYMFGGKDRYPGWLADMYGDKAAYAATKAGALMLLAAAGVYGVRRFRKALSLNSDSALKDVYGQLDHV